MENYSWPEEGVRKGVGKAKRRVPNQNQGEKVESVSYVIKNDTLRKNCPLNKSKKASSSQYATETSAANVTDGCDSTEVLMGLIGILRMLGSWIQGDNGTCDVKGIGSVQIATHDGIIRVLTNVSYVPELKCNLISLGDLERSIYTYKSENGVLKVSKDSLVKSRGTLRNGLYVLEGTAVSGSA
ncbi:hypothetical protein Csa_023133, partial [Cucumis sativus]